MKTVMPQWMTVRPRVANLIPFPNEGEPIPSVPSGTLLARLLWNCSPVSDAVRDSGSDTYAWLCRDLEYGFANVHPRARSQIRKTSREGSEVVRLHWAEAWPHMKKSIKDTWVRQQRQDIRFFMSHLNVLQRVDRNDWGGAVELWAARRKGKFGGFVVGLQYLETYHILHGFSCNTELNWYPNNLLVFKITDRAFNKLNCLQVNYGVHGFDSERMDGLSYFKKRMGFTLEPCEEEFLCHGSVKVAVKVAALCCRTISRFFPTLSSKSFVRLLKGLSERI